MGGGCVDKEEILMVVCVDWLIIFLLDVYFVIIKMFYWNDKVCRNGWVCWMFGEVIIIDLGLVIWRVLELIIFYMREWWGNK